MDAGSFSGYNNSYCFQSQKIGISLSKRRLSGLLIVTCNGYRTDDEQAVIPLGCHHFSDKNFGKILSRAYGSDDIRTKCPK